MSPRDTVCGQHPDCTCMPALTLARLSLHLNMAPDSTHDHLVARVLTLIECEPLLDELGGILSAIARAVDADNPDQVDTWHTLVDRVGPVSPKASGPQLVMLHGGHPVVAGGEHDLEAVDSLVEMLRDIRANVEDGSIRSLVATGEYHDGSGFTAHDIKEGDVHRTIGLIERLKSRILEDSCD